MIRAFYKCSYKNGKNVGACTRAVIIVMTHISCLQINSESNNDELRFCSSSLDVKESDQNYINWNSTLI